MDKIVKAVLSVCSAAGVIIFVIMLSRFLFWAVIFQLKLLRSLIVFALLCILAWYFYTEIFR